ncbi:polymorphic toxin-type HINT domain-containing protein [Streptomyces sp. NPDC088261]|uniref:polymorphic toxin-type HINT domain-containing protein n=1 Tax=Streptomyces sp. NPDC088261 TaxID=3365851 RepID=UPI003818E7D0
MSGRPGRYLSLLRSRVALTTAAVMVGTLLQVAATPVVQADNGLRDAALAAAEKPVKGSASGTKVKPRKVTKSARTPQKAPAAAWPTSASAVLTLPKRTSSSSKAVKAQGLPLTLRQDAKTPAAESATGKVIAQLVDRKAASRTGVDGPLFTLQPQAGSASGAVGTTLDYSGFGEAFGGGYGSRLTLVELPQCALTTPEKKQCRTGKPVKTVNDPERRTLTTDSVELRAGASTVLAAVAAEAGGGGDFTATSLSPSATWKTNLNTGDFTWSYDMPVPGVPGGLKPSVALSYSSGSIDGRTGNTNNQSSWVGDGFDLSPGFIERRYKPCAEDGVTGEDGNKPGDSCWAYDNAFLTFNGKGGELVPAGNNQWKLRKDDGTRVKRLTKTDRVTGNGDDNDEHWELTVPGGTRYYFGYNRLPGWADGKGTTGSTWTVPVFGDDTNEPCHAATFAASWCQQAWRWNLDYAVDVRGNAVAYYYNQEKNSYGRNLKAADDTRYTRGGYLDRIEYGLKSTSVYSAKALAKVTFGSSERCLPDAQTTCSSITSDAFHWYDTPWDLNCDEGKDCDEGRFAASFWTRKRLTSVTTEVLKTDGSYNPVDSWKLTHRWGMADTDYQLLLDSVQRTGHTATPAVTLPKTTFTYTQLENRLDKTGDGYAPFIKSRLSDVSDESGGQIDVTYSAPACDWNNLPTPQTNTTRCFPQFIGGSSSEDPDQQWFNKYVVSAVIATDRTGGAPDQVTSYEYKDGAAWHFDDDDGLTKEKFKTWSQWRGYGHVRVKTGGPGGGDAVKSQNDTYFLRGMDGDKKAVTGNATKSVSVSLGEGEGDPLTDDEAAAGFAYKTESYSGPDGKILAKSVNRPWHHETAKKVRDWGTVTANFTGTAESKTWASTDNGTGAKWRITASSTTFDTVAGRPTQVDNLGDTASARDDRCTRTTYVPNTADTLFNLASRVETVAVKCDATPARAKDVVSDERIAYDGLAYGATPTKGDATASAVLKKHDGTTATYLESGTTFDSYGRPLTSTDLTANVTATVTGAPVRTPRTDGRTSAMAYAPTTGFATTVTATTPPATAGNAATAQKTVTTLDPLRGQPMDVTDTNTNKTKITYDALGRKYKIWTADRSTTSNSLPNFQFDYQVEENKPVAVVTRTLSAEGGSLVPAYTIYDGFLRKRQTQSPGPDGGLLLTDLFYDERGQAAKEFATYYTLDAKPGEVFQPADALSVETQTLHAFDGLGRETETKQIAGDAGGGKVLGITKTIYGGDRVTVIPPEGGTATTTLVDGRGQTTELRQHHERAADSTYDTTAYEHNNQGALAKLTDPAGNTWNYTYDQLGRQTKADDPDKGITDSVYDDRGQLVSTDDARPGNSLFYIYDDLGRQTELHKNSATGPLSAKWVYDTVTNGKGELAESTRYDGSNAYTYKVTQYDRLYQAVRSSVTIPAVEIGLAGTYQTGVSYKPSGLVGAVSYSAAGALPGGSYSFTYDTNTLRPVAMLGNGYSTTTSYSLTGKPLVHELGDTSGGTRTLITNEYEGGTQRLANTRVDREPIPGVDKYLSYRYDQIGNILSAADVSRSGTDNQCYTYDHLRRLTEAWTEPDTTCATTPVGQTIGGPAPYWNSYTYDKTGNRLTETRHDTTGDSGKDLKSTYDYPDAGQPRPHALDSVTTTGPSVTSQDSYTYDETGNTIARIVSGDTQSLLWDAEGRLAKVTETGEGGDKVTDYLYDADGNRLIGRTPTETTLYLGHTEITVAKGTTTPKATRYIDIGEGNQAVQDNNGAVSFTIADHQGTGQLAVTSNSQTLTQRRTQPFGSPRGTQPATWPGTKSFVGGTDDTSTGLTHLGAREYDSGTGRFLSVDPLLDTANPQQLNGYSYAENSPITQSDPSGLMACASPAECGGGLQYGNSPAAQSGKPLNDPSWGCPGCDGDSYDDGWWESSGWSAAPISPSIKPGTVMVFPGVNVPADWKYADKLKQQLNATINRNQYYGGQTSAWVTNPEFEDQPEKAMEDVQRASYIICGNIEGGCPKSVTSAKAFAKAGLSAQIAAGGGEGSSGKWFGARGRNSSPCEANSFIPGTKVLLADGTAKPIEELKVGDRVLATDPETGKTAEKRVTAEIEGQGLKNLVKITLRISNKNGSSTTTVTATDGHPFWVPELQEWIDAADLRAGQHLQSSTGSGVQVTALHRWTRPATVYNLTVADLHTYYVLAGATPVLVHNCGGSLYEAGGKHGTSARGSSRGTNSAEPLNGQAALDNSVPVKGTSPRRVGVDVENGEIVVLDRTVQRPCKCGGGGTNDIYHGHVREWGDLHIDMQNSLRRAGLVDRRGRVTG